MYDANYYRSQRETCLKRAQSATCTKSERNDQRHPRTSYTRK